MSSPEPSVSPERRAAALERLRQRSANAPIEAFEVVEEQAPAPVEMIHPVVGVVALGAAFVAPGVTKAVFAPEEKEPAGRRLHDWVDEHPFLSLGLPIGVIVALVAAVVAMSLEWI